MDNLLFDNVMKCKSKLEKDIQLLLDGGDGLPYASVSFLLSLKGVSLTFQSSGLLLLIITAKLTVVLLFSLFQYVVFFHKAYSFVTDFQSICSTIISAALCFYKILPKTTAPCNRQ